jgi:hypothetical protein
MMGYYENIREENRQLHDIFWSCVIWGMSIVLWLILLSPLWLWLWLLR